MAEARSVWPTPSPFQPADQAVPDARTQFRKAALAQKSGGSSAPPPSSQRPQSVAFWQARHRRHAAENPPRTYPVPLRRDLLPPSPSSGRTGWLAAPPIGSSAMTAHAASASAALPIPWTYPLGWNTYDKDNSPQGCAPCSSARSDHEYRRLRHGKYPAFAVKWPCSTE
jgi:hypothetical protein